MSPAKLQPALLAGVAIGVLSALPVMSIANLCCCAWVVMGGTARVVPDAAEYPAPITVGDGALVGLLGRRDRGGRQHHHHRAVDTGDGALSGRDVRERARKRPRHAPGGALDSRRPQRRNGDRRRDDGVQLFRGTVRGLCVRPDRRGARRAVLRKNRRRCRRHRRRRSRRSEVMEDSQSDDRAQTPRSASPEIDALLQEDRAFAPPDAFRAQANVRDERVYEEAARDPEHFWANFARELEWSSPWTRGPRLEAAARQMVRRRQDQRERQLSRSPPQMGRAATRPR